MNQMCGSRIAAQVPSLNVDAVMCSSVADPNVGIWAQRVTILEESEPGALAKMHAAGVKVIAYFEAFGQAKAYVVQLKKNPDGTWLKDPIDPLLTRRFLNHWNWQRFNGTGEVRWAGSHNYFGDEDYARPYTLTHQRYGSPPVRYPDGTIATGYNGPSTDPRNSRVYDACASKDVNGQPFIDYGYNRAVERREGLLQIDSKYAGAFDIGKDAACPSWAGYARASTLEAIDYGLDGMWTDNFSPWDSFGLEPVKKAFGEWSVATFRDYLAAHFSPAELQSMGVKDLKTFDVRVYIRAKPYDLTDPAWLDDPIWRAYKIHRRRNGTQALTAYYNAVKEAARSEGKPDFPVTGNDFQDYNFGWARDNLDMVSAEIQGAMPPQGNYVPIYKRAREQARGRLGIFWLYVPPELAGHPGIADVLQYQALANHILPEPWAGTRRNRIAGTDATTAAFNAFVGKARETFGERIPVAEIGLYYSSSSELAHLAPGGWPGKKEAQHTRSFQAWGAALTEQHYQWRAIPEWKLTPETLAPLKLLIIADAEVFDPADVPILKAWIAKGGQLVVTGDCGTRAGENQNFQPLPVSSLANLPAKHYLDFQPAVQTDAPKTVAVTLYEDPQTETQFIDLNNTDIDVPTDTIHQAPPIHLTLPKKPTLAQILTPDPTVKAEIRDTQIAITGLTRYASLVLKN
jgi:hypothetical protein